MPMAADWAASSIFTPLASFPILPRTTYESRTADSQSQRTVDSSAVSAAQADRYALQS
jgi:hypothetical protein